MRKTPAASLLKPYSFPSWSVSFFESGTTTGFCLKPHIARPFLFTLVTTRPLVTGVGYREDVSPGGHLSRKDSHSAPGEGGGRWWLWASLFAHPFLSHTLFAAQHSTPQSLSPAYRCGGRRG